MVSPTHSSNSGSGSSYRQPDRPERATIATSEPAETDQTILEAEKVFAERSEQFDRERELWEQQRDSFDGAGDRLAQLQEEHRLHMDSKPMPPRFETRDWSTFDGKYTTTAKLVNTNGEMVKLLREDNETAVVPRSKLIAGDRVYVDDAFEAIESSQSELSDWKTKKTQLESDIDAAQTLLDNGIGEQPQAPNLQSIVRELKEAEKQRLAAEETRQIEAAAKAEAEQERMAEERSEKELKAFATILTVADPTKALFTRVRRRGHKMIVTVSNAWHYQPYQIRLQTAQNLWQGWANIHSPKNPDEARLSVVDMNDNEVAGSRVWAGSLIWVQEE